MPFVLGKAIIVAVLELVRFGNEVISYGDPNHSQIYQVIFMETVGFKVDQVFVSNWIKKHDIPDVKIDNDVAEFLKDKAAFMKEKAVIQYKKSKNPVQKLEFQLNEMIGPTKLKERAQQCVEN